MDLQGFWRFILRGPKNNRFDSGHTRLLLSVFVFYEKIAN